jgi:phage-related minor tail protein
MEIFKLFGSVFIDDKDAIKSLNDIDGKADKTGTTLGSMIGTAAKWVAGLAAGAVAAGAGLFALAANVSDSASEINDMSVRTGLSTDRLQELKFATGQVGVEFDSITGAVGKLTKTMSGADEGSKAAAAAFKKLGIETNDGSGHLRKMDDVFPEVIKKLAGMTNASDRNALAMSFFGKGAMELVPLLDAGGAGIDAMSKQAHELGLVLSKDAVNSADTFGDTLDQIKGALGGVAAKVGVELMPMFQTMMDWVIAHMPEIQNVIHTTFSTAGIVIGTVIDVIKSLTSFFVNHWAILQPILIGIGAGALVFGIYTLAINAAAIATGIWSTVTGIATTVGGAFAVVIAFITSPIGIVILAITALVAVGVLLYKNWDTVSAFLDKVWKAIRDVAISVWNGIAKFFTELWDGISTKATNVFQGIVKFLVTIWDGVTTVFKDVWNGIASFISGIWDGIVSGIKGSINFIIGAINSFINGINAIHITIPSVKIPFTDKTIGGGEISFPNIPNIPMLAEGGDITEAGRVLVGERGPEFLDLPTGARVTPLDKEVNDERRTKTEITNNFHDGAFRIDASSLKDIQDIIDFFKRFPQLARQFGY